MKAAMGQGQREERAMNGTSGPLSWARPATILRAEGAVLLAGGAASYWLNGEPWWLFALLLLAPDVSMVGYLAGPRVGAALYNVFHSYPLPAALGIFGLPAGAPLAVGVASVWFAHIGMDRMVGYGLKYASGFKDTHLERV